MFCNVLLALLALQRAGMESAPVIVLVRVFKRVVVEAVVRQLLLEQRVPCRTIAFNKLQNTFKTHA